MKEEFFDDRTELLSPLAVEYLHRASQLEPVSDDDVFLVGSAVYNEFRECLIGAYGREPEMGLTSAGVRLPIWLARSASEESIRRVRRDKVVGSVRGNVVIE